MTANDELWKLARGIADQARIEGAHPEKEISDLKDDAGSFRHLHGDPMRLFSERLLNFQVKIGGDLQCPRCWVLHETRAPLRPTTSTREHDYFHCDACGYDVALSALY